MYELLGLLIGLIGLISIVPIVAQFAKNYLNRNKKLKIQEIYLSNNDEISVIVKIENKNDNELNVKEATLFVKDKPIKHYFHNHTNRIKPFDEIIFQTKINYLDTKTKDISKNIELIVNEENVKLNYEGDIVDERLIQ